MAGNKSIPESKKTPESSTVAKSHKRKRDRDGAQATTPTPTKKHKKRERLAAASPPSDDSAESRKSTKYKIKSDSLNSPRKESGSSPDGTKGRKKSKDGKPKGSKSESKQIDETAAMSPDPEDDQDVDMSSSEEGHRKSKNKHAGILSKFQRTKTAATSKANKADPEEEEATEVTVEPVIAKGLEPLPQPENPPEIEQLPTYSSLPPWLANPLRTSINERARFADLGIKSDLLRILEQHNYKEAFAVQSTVIPLLLEGKDNHPGDLCISAATGSGKTLSYVLPLVTSLTPRPASRLRGLIVVPTRELVKQAREACELCATGSRLHIGSAVGNVAIKEEQKFLMRVDQVYNPATVAQRQQTGIQGNEWMDFSLEDCIGEAVDSKGFLPGYIQRPETNVDILICTPGRLVDHIRYTKGFTLKHLEWLVIDEADRLLNESFQEWVDVVMGSLDARQSPETIGPGGKLLSDLGLSIEHTLPKKIVLSATMTRDISKLNSLRLETPKMVIIGAESATDGEDPSAAHPDASFTLPSTLHENIIAVGDGSQKPLYLLHLLVSNIKVAVGAKAHVKSPLASSDTSDSESTSSDDTSSDDTSSDDTSSDDTSSDDTSSDESSDDETSSSGSDSDSDSDSDSSDSSSDESSDSSDSDSDTSKPKPEIPSRTTVLIFTKSSESASRLSRLISLLHPSLASRVGTILKSNKSSASRKTLTAFRQGRISVIVATDRASRGLDLPSLSHVVNYDVPTSVTTYVHRVGRTARAGRAGSAWTLVAHREGRWFANEVANSVDGRITRTSSIDRVNVKLDALQPWQAKYAAALNELEQEVKGGKPSTKP